MPAGGGPVTIRVFQWFLAEPPQIIGPAAPQTPARHTGPVDHVVILDGTLSSLEPGHETNAGRTFQQLRSRRGSNPPVGSITNPGMQWQGWRHGMNVAQGRGINRQIRRAYGWLSSRYRPGDRIFLFGYSRGAYAVRSLAGVIDRVGLLRRHWRPSAMRILLYRHYETNPDTPAARRFAP
jgi:uncharacterized protein (DUF2235 family)